MTRKRKTSPLEDLIEIAAKLPWWGGLILAVFSYSLLHYFAVREIPPPKDIRDGSVLTGHLWRGLALGGQYLFPIAFMSGAIVSAVIRYKRRGLVDRVADAKHTGVLNEMSWREFEALVAEGFLRIRGQGRDSQI